jgi:hypothetical protein
VGWRYSIIANRCKVFIAYARTLTLPRVTKSVRCSGSITSQKVFELSSSPTLGKNVALKSFCE